MPAESFYFISHGRRAHCPSSLPQTDGPTIDRAHSAQELVSYEKETDQSWAVCHQRPAHVDKPYSETIFSNRGSVKVNPSGYDRLLWPLESLFWTNVTQ